jgi:spermidine synthase
MTREIATRGASISILCVAALAGACTMTIELAAVRLIAPWFGTSSGVWTNVIGVVLLALSTGYLLGAHLSRRPRPGFVWGFTLLASASCAAWLPSAAGPVSRAFLPSGLSLDEAADLLKWGSLATALVLFLPAALLLGCTPPLAAELLDRENPRGAGAAGGRVLAVSTLGSLAGTFATTYIALPVIGLTRTFLIAGSVLAATGAWLVWRERARAATAAMLFLACISSAWRLSRLRAPDVPDGFRLLESAESFYQSSRVIEGEVDGALLRRLQVNEGLDSFQSVWQAAEGPLPPGYYYNVFALPPLWSELTADWNVLVLGLGGGTAWRVLAGALPVGTTLHTTGVEIDPAIIRLGQTWMDLPRDEASRRVLAGWDARPALHRVGESFDEIVLDAYANQMEIPAHLSTVEFFREVRSHLRTGGWLCVNVGAFGLADPVAEALGGTVASAFDERVLLVRVPFSRNCALFARNAMPLAEPAPLQRGRADETLVMIAAAIALPSAHRWFEPSSNVVLTDDRNPIDDLQRTSIRRGAELMAGRP